MYPHLPNRSEWTALKHIWLWSRHTHLNALLALCVLNYPFFFEVDNIPLTVQSPIHMGISHETPAWIVTHLGIIRREILSDKTKLGPGSLICLHNDTFSQLNLGFESPWVFRIIWGLSYQEVGFHIFPMEVHLFTLTWNTYIIPICITHVAIPNNLFDLVGVLHPSVTALLASLLRGKGILSHPFILGNGIGCQCILSGEFLPDGYQERQDGKLLRFCIWFIILIIRVQSRIMVGS